VRESPTNGDVGDSFYFLKARPTGRLGGRMRTKLLLVMVTGALSLSSAACNEMGSNTNNSNMTANANLASPRRELPTPTATPKYSEEQAREERARAKQNKETVGDALDDAWIHAKIVTKLIGDSKTPERNINVDVVHNEVTLRGTVDTAEAKAEAERIAKETDGVRKVTNQLKVVATKPANSNKK
jgi:hypothetical protein